MIEDKLRKHKYYINESLYYISNKMHGLLHISCLKSQVQSYVLIPGSWFLIVPVLSLTSYVLRPTPYPLPPALNSAFICIPHKPGSIFLVSKANR